MPISTPLPKRSKVQQSAVVAAMAEVDREFGSRFPTRHEVAEARRRQAAYRASEGGFAARPAPLWTAPESSAKLVKSGRKTYVKTYGLTLSPENVSGILNTCLYSTPECRNACLNEAGKGDLADVQVIA